jgi:hypothetical protein
MTGISGNLICLNNHPYSTLSLSKWKENINLAPKTISDLQLHKSDIKYSIYTAKKKIQKSCGGI